MTYYKYMTAPPILILGNRLDLLAKQLAKTIEQDPYDPLAVRLILIPDASLKPWLLLELARFSSRRGVAGLKILSWQEGIRYLLNQPGKEPSYLELYLSVYQALQKSRSPEIVEYLREGTEKLADLSKELADLFLTYGYYGRDLFGSLCNDWQFGVLKELFINGPWRLPIQLLSRKSKSGSVVGVKLPATEKSMILDQFDKTAQKGDFADSGSLATALPVYCFGCNSLPPIVWDFLFRLPDLYRTRLGCVNLDSARQSKIEGSEAPAPLEERHCQIGKSDDEDRVVASSISHNLSGRGITIFHFSPCLSYWGDACSDRERRNLTRFWKKKRASEEKLDELEGYLRDAHPLLANLGKLGRDTLNFFDRYEMQIEELYDPLEGNQSALGRLQRDLLFHEISKPAEADRSLQVNKTGASRLREIQVLRDEIIRGHELGIPFADMIVLAPDLEIYAPLIELVFSDPEIEIPYRMAGIDQLARNSYWQGFKRLLSLSHSRWEVEALLELFENLSFRAKRGWDLDRLDQIRRWVQDARIRWGRDPEQRKSVITDLLGEEVEAGFRGTWEEGADRIVNGMVYLFPEHLTEKPSPSPISGIGLGEADEVEELLLLIDELQRDLRPLSESSSRTLESWARILGDLSEKYLSGDDSGALEEILYSMRYAGEKIDHPYPFSSLSHLFERKSGGQIGSSFLHAVRFASFVEGAIAPCRALFLIGQDEESFPRSFSASSLDLLKGTKEAPPLNSERDRYLFLQAICSARDLVAISYGHISPVDGKDIGPSIVVRELLSYLKDKVSVVVHPSFALHKRCFQDLDCQSMSQNDFRAAQIFYSPKEPLKFLPPFNRRPSAAWPEGEIVLSLRDLASLFRHPWKFYLEKALNLRIEEEEKENWEDFEVDFIKRAQILRASFQQPLNEVISGFEQKGSFPVGLFGEVARLNLTEISEEWNENLSLLEIDGTSLATLHLRDVPGGDFEFPPLVIQGERTIVKIVGQVKHCCTRGPLHIGEDSFSGLLKTWPECLAALCVLKSNSIHCLRSGKIKWVDSPFDSLRRCVDLYFLGLQTPLPLISEWADPLLRKEDPADLQKKIDGGRTAFEDPVHDWVRARMEIPSAEAIFSAWRPFLKESLTALISLYPPRGKGA